MLSCWLQAMNARERTLWGQWIQRNTEVTGAGAVAGARAGSPRDSGYQRRRAIPSNFPPIYRAWHSWYFTDQPRCQSNCCLICAPLLLTCSCSWTVEKVVGFPDNSRDISECLHSFCIKSQTLESYQKKILTLFQDAIILKLNQKQKIVKATKKKRS